MTSIGLLDKHADPSDRRAVTLTLTARELDLRRTYVEEYHAHLGDVLAETTAVPVPRPQLIRHASGRIRVPEIKERTQSAHQPHACPTAAKSRSPRNSSSSWCLWPS